MTDLSEAYEGTVASQRGRHRLYLGVGLFLVGAVLVVAGILAAGSGVLTSRGYSLGQARWLGGVLGGIGVPAVFLGIFTVLPAGRTTRAAALIGASLAMFGVAIFAHAYPCQWIGNNCATTAADLTLPTAGIYFLGTLTTFWCLFIGIANFKIRNDPGGTVRMEVTRKGETKIIETERSGLGGLGGIGLLGADPDGEVETQTKSPPTGGSPTSDGGATTQSLSSPLDTQTEQPKSTQTPNTAGASTQTQGGVDRVGSAAEQSWRAGGPKQPPQPDTTQRAEKTVDRYCGSCGKFRYVRTETGIRPYCGHFDELMEDMDACDEWQPR